MRWPVWLADGWARLRPARPDSRLWALDAVPLTGRARTHTVRRPSGGRWLFTCEVQGDAGLAANSALLRIVCLDSAGRPLVVPGLTPFQGPGGGQYRYLNTRPGTARTALEFELPPDCHTMKLSVRRWVTKRDVRLNWLRIERPQTCPMSAVVTVDVEALPRRTDTDHVNRLIHGRRGAEPPHGVGRLCDLFDAHGVRATFFVEYAACAHYGDGPIFDVAEMLAKRGHDVQLHLHPDIWLRAIGRLSERVVTPGFDAFDRATARDALAYGIEKYQANLGRRPRVFRPGLAWYFSMP
jgi:hypothetical protein